MSIWYRDLVNFFDMNNALVLYPTSDMVYSEKLNSIMRMVLYASIILYSLLNDSKVFVMLIVVGVIIYIMYELDDNKEAFERDRYAKYRGEEDDMYATEDNVEHECTQPTRENPFMNVTMNEYAENPKRGRACKMTKKVNEYIDDYFNDNLYRSVDDIYNKNASERQYYTMPVTEIPNKQHEFAQWLYGNDEKTCKEGNGLKCKYFS